MPHILFILFFSLKLIAADHSAVRPVDDQPSPKCKEVESYGEKNKSTHSICEVRVANGKTKNLHLMNLKGTFKEISKAQGYLLAKETDKGIFGEMGPKVVQGITSMSPIAQSFAMCIVHRMESSVSPEFSQAATEFYNGYMERAQKEGNPKTEWKPMLLDPKVLNGMQPETLFKFVAYGIELENVIDALKHGFIDNPLVEKMKEQKIPHLELRNLREDLSNVRVLRGYVGEIIRNCGGTIAKSALQRMLPVLSMKDGEFAKMLSGDSFISELFHLKGKLGASKIGCTGFVSPTGKEYVHARNLDSDTVNSWNEEPTLNMVTELDDKGKEQAKYVSPGTAGMFYPGGVGGMNEHGVTTSLHQMYTNTYKLSFPAGTAEIGPFTNQKVLRTAKNIKEAEDIIRGINHYGAWTELVSDSKTGDVVSIEMSAAGVDIGEGRKSRNEPMVQTNHFVSGIKDSAYTPYFNKYLESRGRFKVVEDMLSKEPVDTDYAIRILSNHHDHFEKGDRSFGRTAAKAYGVMSTIMLPKKNEFWMTVGENTDDPTTPHTTASHTTFVGFNVDWDKGILTPIAKTKRNTEWDDKPEWTKSLASYITGRTEYQKGNKQKTLEHLNKAIEQAEKDFPSDKTESKDIRQLPYYFMRARLLGELGKFQEATNDWEYLWKKYEYLGEEFPNAYQRALAGIYSVSNKALAQPGNYVLTKEDYNRLGVALRILGKYQAAGIDHYDLGRKIKYATSLLNNPGKVKVPPTPLDFVFIE